MHRMGLVKRKASTKKSTITSEKFEEVKTTFLQQVGHFAKAHTIPADLVINWDQTGINVVPSSNYAMEERGAGRAEIAGYGDKRMSNFCCHSLWEVSSHANLVWCKD